MRAGSCTALLSCLVTLVPASIFAQETKHDDRLSGSVFMSAETRALQADDTANPAMLSVQQGEDIWNEVAGLEQKSCAACHGDAAKAMKGVAARYPAFDPASGKPVTLQQRVNICRTERQKANLFKPESPEQLAITAYLGLQSRGLPITPPDDPRLKPFTEAGASLFHRKQGQLNMSCSTCHDGNWGKSLGGSPIPQAHPTGYPIYRLEWQGMGSLERRLRNCMVGVRAEPFAFDAEEMVELELYLAQRAEGMTIETPAVRP